MFDNIKERDISEESLDKLSKELDKIPENESEIYKSKGEISKISVTSRASVNIGKNYYTFECMEEKCFPISKYGIDFDIMKEKQIMWEDVNREVDNQIQETIEWINEQQNSNY